MKYGKVRANAIIPTSKDTTDMIIYDNYNRIID